MPRGEIEAGLLQRGVEPARRGRGCRRCPRPPGPRPRLRRRTRPPRRPRPHPRTLRRGRCCRPARPLRLRPLRSPSAGAATRPPVRFELECWEAYWEAGLRAAAARGDRPAIAGALEALRAIADVREHLLASVQARPAFDLMLLRFPRGTLVSSTEEELPAHA
ncbi:hypothetical protein O0235_07690 [Tepidiforma flava]|uniref:DUF309 domain-containing protein n=1 Tax=Tepidiforma flava TaxID=3004094 RepID=A0ABY7MA63_9CHLR|nr:hypothetical protein [Tepidiforma flava]WBL37448.1 hypothetical protein O0235_07690 [Tepidiforma flava]